MMNCMNKFVWILLIVGIISSAAVAQTDTVYIRKHVTDTVFVKSPPDTVYIKKIASKAVDSIPEKNEFVTYYDTDTIPPAINFYIDGSVGANIILLALGVGVFGFEFISRYSSLLKGPVALTTQSYPRDIVYNFGGFTDGDRAVCFARHFGCRRILLPGFDYDHPMPKEGSDPAMKSRKLAWAKRIIEDMNPPGVELVYRCHRFIE